MLVEGLIRRLQEYGGVKELLNNNSSIVCNSIQEEALALAAAYKRKKQKIVHGSQKNFNGKLLMTKSW